MGVFIKFTLRKWEKIEKFEVCNRLTEMFYHVNTCHISEIGFRTRIETKQHKAKQNKKQQQKTITINNNNNNNKTKQTTKNF